MTGFSAANFLRRLLHQRTPWIPSFLGSLPQLPESSCALQRIHHKLRFCWAWPSSQSWPRDLPSVKQGSRPEFRSWVTWTHKWCHSEARQRIFLQQKHKVLLAVKERPAICCFTWGYMIFATCFLERHNCRDFFVDLEFGGPIFFLKSKPSNGQPLLFLDIPWSALQLCVEVVFRVSKSWSQIGFFAIKYKVSKEWV